MTQRAVRSLTPYIDIIAMSESDITMGILLLGCAGVVLGPSFVTSRD